MGIDQFNPAGAASCTGSVAAVPAQVQLAGCQVSNNVASDSGGGIYMLNGIIGLTVSQSTLICCTPNLTLATLQSCVWTG